MFALTSFGGIIPRTPWHLLPENAATIAHDVKLRNGKIQAWRERTSVAMGVGNAVTMYYKGCCALTWAECVSVADYVTDYARMYITGRVDYPEVMVLNDCTPTYYRLGVPTPTMPPTINGTPTDGRDCAARSYVYTFVNMFGEESAPSPVSTQITVKDGDTVTVSGFGPIPTTEYAVEEIWVYRTATAYREYHAKEQEPLTDFLKVGELSIDGGTFTDNIMDKGLGSVLNTREVREPPAALRQINYLRGTGVLTGATWNGVHFSAPFQPYNWPTENDLTLPYNIVHMVTLDDKLFISTDAYPYVIDGGPSCEPRQCRPVTDVDTPLPDIACGYAHSAISTPFGMMYVSKDGVVLVSVNATYQIITAKWFSSDDWVKIRPDSARLAYWRGYLIVVTDTISFMLEIDADTYGDFRTGELVTISDQPIDMIVSSYGELLMLDPDRLIYQWNTNTTLRPYIWESRELKTDHTIALTTAKVRARNTLFKLLTPLEDLAYERQITTEDPFRLGRLGRHQLYRVGFYGTGDVEQVILGTSELMVNKGQ